MPTLHTSAYFAKNASKSAGSTTVAILILDLGSAPSVALTRSDDATSEVGVNAFCVRKIEDLWAVVAVLRREVRVEKNSSLERRCCGIVGGWN